MRDDAVFSDIKALLARNRPTETPIAPETELAADLNIDSVAAMDLIMEIEDRFEIDIPVNQVGDMRTVGDLVALVRGQLNGG